MATTVLTSKASAAGRGSWQSQPCRVDITGWEKKVKNVLEVQARVCEQVVTWGLDELMKRTVQHVTGPRYGTKTKKSKSGSEYVVYKRGPLTNAGRLPVPVITGQLRRSIKTLRFNTVFGAVWSDPRIAPYNNTIHQGGMAKFYNHSFYMKPRPFLQAAVDIERPRILEFMKKRILEEVGKAGGQGSLF